jgi:hypothetical protein
MLDDVTWQNVKVDAGIVIYAYGLPVPQRVQWVAPKPDGVNNNGTVTVKRFDGYIN